MQNRRLCIWGAEPPLTTRPVAVCNTTVAFLHKRMFSCVYTLSKDC